jgi:DHA2 family multidrug resistance protein
MVALGFGALQVVLDRFQQDDGFGSPLILALTILCVVALSFLVLWELQHPQPAVNVRLLGIRSFAVSNIVMFLIGFLLISTTQLLPQLTQELMGYDATTSGLTLGLGGACTILVMPLAGILTGRILPPRVLLATALIISGLALLHMSRLSLDMSFWTVARARTFQAIALPFLFIPISAVSYNGVPPGKNNDASAIINLTRNLGGSVGVSLASTMLAWRTQFHHARLSEHITAATDLHGRSLAQMDHVIHTQASIMSYLDIFRMLGITALMLTPIVLLLRPSPKGAVAVGH